MLDDPTQAYYSVHRARINRQFNEFRRSKEQERLAGIDLPLAYAGRIGDARPIYNKLPQCSHNVVSWMFGGPAITVSSFSVALRSIANHSSWVGLDFAAHIKHDWIIVVVNFTGDICFNNCCLVDRNRRTDPSRQDSIHSACISMLYRFYILCIV